MSLIIGLGSKARVGKNWIADQMSKLFDVEQISFAKKVKDDLNEIYSYIPGINFHSEDPAIKNNLRPIMVGYANKLRDYDPTFWVSQALDNRDFNHQVTMITDVRYPNEVDYIKQLGGVYIDIDGGAEPANEAEAYNSPLCQTKADFVVKNDRSDQFITVMQELISKLLPKVIYQYIELPI